MRTALDLLEIGCSLLTAMIVLTARADRLHGTSAVAPHAGRAIRVERAINARLGHVEAAAKAQSEEESIDKRAH